MKQSFDWGLIPAFLAALDCGSLLGAARALQSSQPTVGRHIAELEAQIGVVLFERTGRGLLPTATAHKLAEAARAMEHGALQLTRGVSQAASEVSGAIRLSASQPVACVLLPPVLARMRSALPQVQVDLVVSNTVTNLLRREADIALRMVQPEQATLIARRIGRVSVGAYAQREYLRRRGTPAQATDLRQHDLVGHDQLETILQGFAKGGLALRREDFAMRTDDLIAYHALVRAGLGIGFIADYLARDDATLVRVLPQLKIPPIPMWLVVHREIRTSPRIRAVFDFLCEAVPPALEPA